MHFRYVLCHAWYFPDVNTVFVSTFSLGACFALSDSSGRNIKIAALSSITNRVTGCALSVGCAGLGALELVGGSGTSLQVMHLIGSQGGLVAAGAKFSVAFPIVYHYLGALRHIYWDITPDILTNEGVAKASKLLFGGSTFLSVCLVFV